jgi:hypothetical protein
MNEINRIKLALKRQSERRATFEDINYLILKESQYGTLNTQIIKELIR